MCVCVCRVENGIWGVQSELGDVGMYGVESVVGRSGGEGMRGVCSVVV